MIDAATIGITLALQDGVSDGIAAIRRDLSALDRATDGTAINLGRLSALAATLQNGPLSRLTETLSRAANSALPRAETPSRAPPDTNETAMPAAPFTAPAEHTAPANTPAGIRPAPLPPSTLQEQRRRDDAAAPPAIASFAPQTPVPILAGPSPPVLPTTAPSPLVVPTSTAAATAPPAAARAATNLTFGAPPSAPSLAPSQGVGPRAAHAPSRPNGDFYRQAAPIAAADTAHASAPATNRDSQTDDAKTGRIIMEGYELGRWMTDRLTREASRPPAGATGFDPRLSPAWPGAASGL